MPNVKEEILYFLKQVNDRTDDAATRSLTQQILSLYPKPNLIIPAQSVKREILEFLKETINLLGDTDHNTSLILKEMCMCHGSKIVPKMDAMVTLVEDTPKLVDVSPPVITPSIVVPPPVITSSIDVPPVVSPTIVVSPPPEEIEIPNTTLDETPIVPCEGDHCQLPQKEEERKDPNPPPFKLTLRRKELTTLFGDPL